MGIMYNFQVITFLCWMESTSGAILSFNIFVLDLTSGAILRFNIFV